MAHDIDIEELTITRALADFAAGAYSAVALVEAYLARIARHDRFYNAFTHLDPTALDQARAIDKRRAAGEAMPSLAGAPLAIKESIDVAGMPSTLGWARLSAKAGGVDLIPSRDAPLVARLRAAGAIIIGKTNIPPFSGDGTRANRSWAGTTYNAFHRAFAPGASSTGVATAVCANFALAGVAEETGSSIQSPAAAQGIVGIRPTFALVPNTGVAPVAGSTRDVLGPHARNVTDAALMLNVLAGYTLDDQKTVAAQGRRPIGGYASQLTRQALRGKRIGLYGPGWREKPLTAEVAALYAAEMEKLKALGATLVEDPFAKTGFAELPPLNHLAYADCGKESIAHDLEMYLDRMGPEGAIASLAQLKAAVGAGPFDEGEPLARWTSDPIVGRSLRNPRRAPDLSAFLATRERALALIGRVMRERGIDALVYPQMMKETPKLEGDEKIEPTTVSEINIAGLPGVIVPAGYFASGAPFSLIFFGQRWREADLLGMAFAYEQATLHRRAPALVTAA